MILTTPRLFLRPFQATDLQAVQQIYSNPKLEIMAGWAPQTTLAGSQRVLADFMQGDDVFALVMRPTRQVIGSIGLHRQAPDTATRELGFILAEAYWGQGLMPEAVQAIETYGFEQLQLTALWVGHFQSNQRSQRVIEKAGFHFEYELERPQLFADDRPTTECYYQLTAAEYWREKHTHA